MTFYIILFCTIFFIAFAFISFICLFLFADTVFSFVYLYIECKLGKIKEAKIPILIKNFWQEYILILSKFFLYPVKFINLDKRTKNKTAIVLVHGYCRHQADWLFFKNKLSSLSDYSIFTVNLSPNFAAIQQIADPLQKKITAIKKSNAFDNIVLIGHSMGGLVACYYAETLDHDNFISTVITIGTPLQGTKVAVAGYGDNARQMQPESKFLIDLNQQIQHSDKKYYSVASKLDNRVFPWRSALLVNESNNLTLDTTSHLGLIYSTTVINKVNSWISHQN